MSIASSIGGLFASEDASNPPRAIDHPGTTSGTGTGDGGGSPRAQSDLRNLSRQTKKAMTWLIALAILGFVLLLWSAAYRPNGLYFLTWASIAAGSALIAGGALGLLFGLPTPSGTTVITNTATAAAPPTAAPTPTDSARSSGEKLGQSTETKTDMAQAADPATTWDTVDIGYRDSTSLEQVADWLTKIIIGLTLTQWSTWEAKFQILATNLSIALLGLPARPPSPPAFAIPGGVLLAFYAGIGFLVSYLWMRRFFILEMVTARREAREAMALRGVENQRRKAETIVETLLAQQAQRQAEIEAARMEEERLRGERAALQGLLDSARAKGLAPTGGDGSAPSSLTAVRKTVQNARALVPLESRAAAIMGELAERVGLPPFDPDDPWRGKFGGAAAANGVVLEATVTTTSDPNTFAVELAARAMTPDQALQLAGTKAIYFLHTSFGDQPRVSTFGADGRAPLKLYAWGAFTVGVILEDGTMLELNLATLPGTPDLFRIR